MLPETFRNLPQRRTSDQTNMAEHYSLHPDHLNGRYKPDGPLVKQLREKRGWTHEALASRAKCSARTIGNIERGRRAYAATLASVAATFGKKFSAILLNPPPEPKSDGKSKTDNCLPVGVVLDESFDEYDQTQQLGKLINELAKSLGIKGRNIYVVFVNEGSVVIRLLIPKKSVIKLFYLFQSRKLETLPSRVLAIDLPGILRMDLSLFVQLAKRVELAPETLIVNPKTLSVYTETLRWFAFRIRWLSHMR